MGWVHRWGWKVTLHGDGTTTAVSPDGSKTFHSHGPPGGGTTGPRRATVNGLRGQQAPPGTGVG